jgi:predicted ester cyclase
VTPSPEHLAPAEVAREWFQKVWNDKDEAAIDRLLNLSGSIHGLQIKDAVLLRGPDEFKKFYRAMTSAIPDIKVSVSRLTEQGEWVAVKFEIEGTHTGPGISAAPSNNKVAFSGMCQGRVVKGQWVECWNTVDFSALSQQIGDLVTIG